MTYKANEVFEYLHLNSYRKPGKWTEIQKIKF